MLPENLRNLAQKIVRKYFLETFQILNKIDNEKLQSIVHIQNYYKLTLFQNVNDFIVFNKLTCSLYFNRVATL